jgi:hypothetical protein
MMGRGDWGAARKNKSLSLKKESDMRNKLRIIGMVCLGALLFVSVFAFQEERGKEPVKIGYLKIDGVEHEIRIGEEARLVIAGKEHLLKLRLAPFRVFEKAGCRFITPRRCSSPSTIPTPM